MAEAKTAHVAAGLRDDHLGDGPVDPGDGVEQVERGTKGSHRLLDPGVQLPDGVGELVVVIQVQPGQEGVVGAEAAGQRLGELGDRAAELALGHLREDLGISFAADECLQHGPAGDAHDVGGDRGQFDPGVLQQLLQALDDLTALAGELGAGSGQVP